MEQVVSVDSIPPSFLSEEIEDVVQDNHSVIWAREDSGSLDLIPSLGGGRGPEVSRFLTKELTVDDLENSSDFSWKVIKEKMNREHKSSNRKIFTHESISRSDTGKEIGMVTAGAKVLQNSHLFSFVRPFVDSGAFVIDAVRSIDGGRSIVVVMKNVALGKLEAFQGDSMEAFTVARLTRGSTAQINVGSMLYRLICSNGLMALDVSKHKIDTSKPIGLAGKEISSILEKNSKRSAIIVNKLQEMAQVKMSTPQNDEYFRRACGLPWNDPNLEFDCPEDQQEHFDEMEKKERTVNKIFASTQAMEETMPEERHMTLECSYQGLTHYITNVRSSNPNTRFKQLNWGSGRKIADRGFDLACDIMSKALN